MALHDRPSHTFLNRVRHDDARRSDCIDDVEIASPEPSQRPAWDAVSTEQLAGAIENLADDFGRVYRLHAVEALSSYQEIAERLGIPTNTVGTRLARARLKLRTMLEGASAAGTHA